MSQSLLAVASFAARCLGVATLALAASSSTVHAQQSGGNRTAADNWKSIVGAAQKEGRVVLYTAIPAPVVNRFKADFEAANPGIILEFSRFNTGELLTKLGQERQTSADGADVMIGTDIAWAEDRIKEGALKAPIGPALQAWPARYMLKGIVPALALEPILIAYNTNLIKTPISGYQDLLKPEFKGKVGVLEITATTTLAFYDWLEKTEGADYLIKLAAQQPRIYVSAPTGGQSVAAGEIPVISFVNPANIVGLVQQGAPVRVVTPKPSFGFRYVGAVLGWAKRPNSAQVFLDYLMSPRGQAAWSGKGEAASPLKNIAGALDADPINPYDPAPYTPEVIKNYKDKWDKLFKGR